MWCIPSLVAIVPISIFYYSLMESFHIMVRKMDQETKKFLTIDHSTDEKESLLKQIGEAEAKGLYNYQISVASAWYEIENGIIKGSGRKM